MNFSKKNGSSGKIIAVDSFERCSHKGYEQQSAVIGDCRKLTHNPEGFVVRPSFLPPHPSTFPKNPYL